MECLPGLQSESEALSLPYPMKTLFPHFFPVHNLKCPSHPLRFSTLFFTLFLAYVNVYAIQGLRVAVTGQLGVSLLPLYHVDPCGHIKSLGWAASSRQPTGPSHWPPLTLRQGDFSGL